MTAEVADNLIADALETGKSGKSSDAVGKIATLFKALNAATIGAASDGDGDTNSSETGSSEISVEKKEAITKAGISALDQAISAMTATPEGVSQVRVGLGLGLRLGLGLG